MPQTNNRGRPKQELETDEKSWFLDFLDRPDIIIQHQVREIKYR